MDGWQRSGVSQRDYCSQRGLALSTFTLWRRRLSTTQLRALPVGVVDLVPVPRAFTAPTPVSRQTSASVLSLQGGQASPVVVVVGQFRLEVSKGFDVDTLRAVVGALETRR